LKHSPEPVIVTIRIGLCPCAVRVKLRQHDLQGLRAGCARKLAHDELCHRCLAIFDLRT
jgi:hypothetical protein